MACTSEDSGLSVSELIANADILVGKPVKIHGYLLAFSWTTAIWKGAGNSSLDTHEFDKAWKAAERRDSVVYLVDYIGPRHLITIVEDKEKYRCPHPKFSDNLMKRLYWRICGYYPQFFRRSRRFTRQSILLNYPDLFNKLIVEAEVRLRVGSGYHFISEVLVEGMVAVSPRLQFDWCLTDLRHLKMILHRSVDGREDFHEEIDLVF